MNKRRNFTMASMIIVTGLCASIANATNADKSIKIAVPVATSDKSIKKPSWTGLLKNYFTSATTAIATHAPSVIIAATIGATTGTICHYLENKSPVLISVLITWIVMPVIRTKVIRKLTRDIKGHGLPNNDELTFATARLAAWGMYLTLTSN